MLRNLLVLASVACEATIFKNMQSLKNCLLEQPFGMLEEGRLDVFAGRLAHASFNIFKKCLWDPSRARDWASCKKFQVPIMMMDAKKFSFSSISKTGMKGMRPMGGGSLPGHERSGEDPASLRPNEIACVLELVGAADARAPLISGLAERLGVSGDRLDVASVLITVPLWFVFTIAAARQGNLDTKDDEWLLKQQAIAAAYYSKRGASKLYLAGILDELVKTWRHELEHTVQTDAFRARQAVHQHVASDEQAAKTVEYMFTPIEIAAFASGAMRHAKHRRIDPVKSLMMTVNHRLPDEDASVKWDLFDEMLMFVLIRYPKLNVDYGKMNALRNQKTFPAV